MQHYVSAGWYIAPSSRLNCTMEKLLPARPQTGIDLHQAEILPPPVSSVFLVFSENRQGNRRVAIDPA
jgi:hypothetical protein